MSGAQHRGAPLVLSTALALVATACSGVQPVESLVLLNQRDCQNVSAGVQETTLATISTLRRSRLLAAPDSAANSESGSAPDSTPVTARADLPALTSTRLFAISKGIQPTPGFAFALQSLSLNGGELQLRLDWQSPPADAVLPQMTTQPCIVVGIPDTAARELVILDQSGEIARLTLTTERSPP